MSKYFRLFPKYFLNFKGFSRESVMRICATPNCQDALPVGCSVNKKYCDACSETRRKGKLKMCEREGCDVEFRTKSGDRYCKVCRKIVLKERIADGSIDPVTSYKAYRGPEAREKTHETKFGTGHG